MPSVHPEKKNGCRRSKRRLAKSRSLLLALLAGWGSPALAQELPPLPNGVTPQAPATQAPANVRQAGAPQLKNYAVPHELVGAVGAQLQLAFHNNPGVQVTTDPNSGELMVLAQPAVHEQISAVLDALMSKISSQVEGISKPLGSTQQHKYNLKNLTWRELEMAISKLAGPKLSVTTHGQYATLQMVNRAGTNDLIQVDRKNNAVTFVGNSPSASGWGQIIYSLDHGQADPTRPTHIIPLTPAEPRRVRNAIRLVNATLNPQEGQVEAQIEMGDDEPAMAMDSFNSLGTDTGLFGDVQIEFIEEIDLVIIKGSKRDVQRTLEVIEKIKQQAIDTQPDVEVYPLKHANAEAVEELVTELYENIYANRQGPISISALGQPNALLLIGRKEVIQSVKDLINKIDQPLDPQDQLKVMRLLHASAVDVEARIREFFVQQPPDGDLRTRLGNKVKVLADFRTNSLIIQAAPREMVEVEKLISELDVEGTTAQNEVRVFRLSNTLAEDLQTVIEEVITGQADNNGNASDVTPPSGKLSLNTVRDGKIESGILAGVVITADPTANALVIRAPSQSMDLISKLIEELDQLPSAEARIKVFQLENGDATSLAQTLQGLFGLPVTAGQNATGNFLTNLSQNTLTTGGESSLVQLQIAADARTNSIIVSGGSSDLEVLEVLLLRLDEDVLQKRRSEVVWLRNANSDQVAAALTTYFQNVASTQQLLNQGTTQIASVAQIADSQVFVVAETDTNTLLISATPDYLEQALQLIERLDRRPPLVSVQIMVAEVQLDDSFELGAEWGIQDGLLFDRGSATGGTLSSPVFNLGAPLTSSAVGLTQNVAGQALSSFGVGRSNASGQGGLVLSASSEAVGVLVRALQTANRLQILNRPNITTLDNREATALVGQLVPRVTDISQATVGVPQQIVTEDVQVGLNITVLPRVNEDGLILLRARVENSSVGDPDAGIPIGFGANGEVIRSPIINSTQAETTVTAYSGQTVVFAGLISKTRGSARSQIPILGSLPLVGPAFRFDVETEQRRELLVVMTPRIIETNEDYELLKQIESSRMSWCLADVLNAHGDVGLEGGNGLWGPARSTLIYPRELPPTLQDRSRPRAGFNQIENQMYPGLIEGLPPGAIIEPSTIIEAPVIGPNAQIAPEAAETTNSTASQGYTTQLQSVSYARSIPQPPPATGAQGQSTPANPAVQQGAYR